MLLCGFCLAFYISLSADVARPTTPETWAPAFSGKIVVPSIRVWYNTRDMA